MSSETVETARTKFKTGIVRQIGYSAVLKKNDFRSNHSKRDIVISTYRLSTTCTRYEGSSSTR